MLIVVVLIGLFFLISVLLALLIHWYGQSDRQHPADAIVVLAGPTYRADHAATLWRKGIAPYLVCTGGLFRQTPLAEACHEYFLGLGIPTEAIVLESMSLSTEEHALNLRPIMEAHGWRSVVVVSSDYHLFRAMLIFRQHHLVAYPSPAPRPDDSNDRYRGSLFREVIATEWQVVKTVSGLKLTRIDWF